MAAERIYGEFQTAGFKITTTGKANVNNSGTDALALAMVQVDTSGNPVGPSGTNPNANPAAIYTDQQAVTATAAPLTAQALVNGIVLTASPLNVIDVMVGGPGVTATNDGTGNGYALAPGQSISFGVTNASAVYVIASTTGAFVSVAGS